MDPRPHYVGFTGGRSMPTPDDRLWLTQVLRELAPAEFHHGDCVGADEDAHMSVVAYTTARIVVHPPDKNVLRAYCQWPKDRVTILHPLPYIRRNHAIVNACEILIAMPERAHLRRSGTWSTVRYALHTGKPVIVPERWEQDLELARKAVSP